MQYYTQYHVCLRLFNHAFSLFLIFSGDYVAHIKFTVLLMPNGSDRITSHSLQEIQPTKTVDDPEIKAWLALGVKTKKKGGGKKKKGMILKLCAKAFSHIFLHHA